MSDLFIFNVGGDDADERRARQEAERLRLRARYQQHLAQTVGIDEPTAERVMAALFDPMDRKGTRCPCSCHPSLSELHDDGFGCNCTWDEARRAKKMRSWTEFLDGPETAALREHHAEEEKSIADWVAGQPDVRAERTTQYAPEQWKGAVDGHSFYFRERHGSWRIEVDLEPSGRFADRLVEVRKGGEVVTELTPIMEGQVIAEGIDSQLGESAIAHIDFIVRAIRDYLWVRQCDHLGALFFCPKCGERMVGPS